MTDDPEIRHNRNPVVGNHLGDASQAVRNEGLENRSSFHAEARFQRVCAVCGGTGAFQAHHVVYEQTLKRAGLIGKELYNTLNALRLCKRCHERHHNGTRKVKVQELRLQNLRYGVAILGAYAIDWICRYYDCDEPDPRIDALKVELEF